MYVLVDTTENLQGEMICFIRFEKHIIKVNG